jgi:glycosyltransferase involved in cell wall biosynthesis
VTIFPLPFSPIVREENLGPIISRTKSVKNDFLTGEFYFIISNQFWIHKDHRSAFQAFAQVAQMSELSEFKLVCTGLKDDYRFPGYFDELKVLVKNLGIQDRVIFTGYIDKLEQLALVNGAVALVQPTLFEGGPGGGSTYDAIALGVPCLLSDIPVNLEIKNPLVSFFKASNAESLAKMLLSASSNSSPRPAKDILLEKSRLYARGLGLSLFEIANELSH